MDINCSHGETNSKDVGFLISTSISYNIVQQDNIGRVLELQLSINGHSWNIVTVYCPAEQKDRVHLLILYLGSCGNKRVH